jgi:putative sterol carrier protein
MNMSSQAREVIEKLPGAFLPEKAGAAKALIQFNLTGDGGGEWALNVADGKCDVQEGTVSSPDVTLTMTGDDFAAMYKGQLNPVQAFMGGKIKVAGNVGLVMNLLNWFER